MIEKRKDEHIEICLDRIVSHKMKTGFDDLSFTHCALPEISLGDIDTTIEFLGKKLSAPILISAMTGGTSKGAEINKNLAIAAEKVGVAMCLGSMRVAIADPSTLPTFDIRKHCPSIPLLSNIGAVQLNYGFGLDECKKAIESINSDGLVFHLNPLQEALQPDGDTNFNGIQDKIERIIDGLDCPVIVKEVGSGISRDVAKRLKDIGVTYIDTAGTGGTSWSRIEGYRSGSTNTFDDWGIPTVVSIKNCVSAKVPTIASGGLKTGVDLAKSLVLGAELGGFAITLLKAATKSPEEVVLLLERIIRELKITMFCVGACKIEELKRAKLTSSS